MTRFSIMTALDPKAPIGEVSVLADAAEALGFHKLWLWDSWASKDGYIGLALAAQHTERLLLGTGVAPTPLRHSALLVNAIATVDDISGGRAVLGIGSGGQATCGRLGVPKARIAEFRAEIELIRRLLAGEEVVGGQPYRVESVTRPIPPLHRGVGTTHAGALRRARRRGDHHGPGAGGSLLAENATHPQRGRGRGARPRTRCVACCRYPAPTPTTPSP